MNASRFHQTFFEEPTHNYRMIRLWNDSQLERSRVAKGLHEGQKVEALVLIDRPPQEVFGYFRDHHHLPLIVPYLQKVHPLSGDQSKWVWRTSQGAEVICHIELISEIENRMISWQTLPDSPLHHAGSVWFREVSNINGNGSERSGTEVHVLLRYNVPHDQDLTNDEREAAHSLGDETQSVVDLSLRKLKKLLEIKKAATEVPPHSKEKMH